MTDDLAAAAGEAFATATLPPPQASPFPVPGSRNPTVPAVRSLTASAKRIRIDTAEGRQKFRKPRELYQKVWDLRVVPEAGFAIRFMGNAMSRLRLFPALIVDPKEAPIDMFDAVDDPEIRLPEQFALDAMAELERLSSGPGGQGAMMSAFGQSLMAVGDSYMVGRPSTEEDLTVEDEFWQVYSPSNIVKDQSTNTLRIKEAPDEPGEVIPDDSLLYRIWRRDAQWPAWSDSGMFSVISELEEMEIISRQFRALSRSRTPAGILLIPSELDPRHQGQARAADGNGQNAAPIVDPADGTPPVTEWTPFDLALIKSLITPTEDDGSAAQVVPHIIKGAGETLEKVRHLQLDRLIDPNVIARMDALVRRFAHGVDLPVEVITGIADSNHWNAWFIGDDTYRAHVEPTASIPASGLAGVHLRPALLQNWPVDIVRLATFGIDPSQLVVRPNRAADAKDAHDRLVISDAAYRRYLAMPDSDAPEDEELARRMALNRGVTTADITAQLLERTGVVDEPLELSDPNAPSGGGGTGAPEDDGDPDAPIDGGEPTPSTNRGRGLGAGARPAPTGPDAYAALIAAAVQLPDLGQRLGTIEARLLDRLVVAASDAVQDALNRAGNRLRSAVQQTPLADEVRGVPADEVGITLGTDRSPVIDTDVLLAGAFAGLEDRWRAWTTQAQIEARAAITEAVGNAGLTDASIAEQTNPDGDLDAGWAALVLALQAYTGPLIFKAAAAEAGEFDATVRVPAGIVRDALSVAGGGTASAAPFGTAAQSGPPGLLFGPRWRLTLQRLHIVASGWTWHTGMPSVPFPPHHDLANVEFTSWTDEVLVNGLSFPRTSHYFPGDHRGCQCYTTPTLVQVAATLPGQEVAA